MEVGNRWSLLGSNQNASGLLMFTFPHFVQSFVLNDSKGIEENSLLNVLFTCERIWELGVDARGVCVGAPS